MNFKLRDYQIEAVNSCLEDLKTNDKICVVLPTGLGKTSVFIDLSDKFIKENPTKSVVTLSHLSLLTDQTMDRFSTQSPHLKVGILQASQRPDPFSNVVISTMQSSAIEHKVADFKKRAVHEVGMVVVDESHYIYTNSYEKALSYFPNAKVVGFTATPYRQNEFMTDYFQKVSYTISLKEGIDKGHLVAPELKEIVRESNQIEHVCALVVSLYKQLEMGKSAIVYMKTIEDCELLRNLFETSGISCSAVTSEIGSDERRKIFASYADGTTKVLTTVNVLTAGFDCPRVESIFMPYGTRSVTQYIQRIGRGLRPCREINKQSCRVYCFGSAPSISKKRFRKINEEALSFGEAPKKITTYTDELEWGDFKDNKEKRIWTETICRAIEKMQKIGFTNVSNLVNSKKFPERFMGDINAILEAMTKNKRSLPNGGYSATDKQIMLLKRNGFTDEAFLHSVTKDEASSMIAALMNTLPTGEFVVKFGPHRGKHVRDLPYAYRSFVKRHHPSSSIAKLIVKWEGSFNESVAI